ncbi:MAG: SGNH/GDSL hydrolase family protein [Marinoscillum sp.]
MKIIYLFVSLVFLSCMEDPLEPVNSQEFDEMEDQDTTKNDNPLEDLTYLALGDSYTIGESVEESKRWPVQLVEDLRSAGVEISDPQIIARTGWTTNELIGAIDASNIQQPYDLVSLLIGVNNQYRGYPISQQEEEFEKLLKMAIEYAGGDKNRVFVVSIPDYGVTPFGQSRGPEKIAKEIDAYNALNKSIADTYEVRYFDITPISREAINKPEYVANDGLHPSAEMYDAWVGLMYPKVREMFPE